MHSSDVMERSSAASVSQTEAPIVLPKPKQRYENIDALRAIAALAVVVQHFFGDILREGTVHDGAAYRLASASVSYFDAGRFGVVLFFLISGFVVPFSIRGMNPLRRFAISRFFRLYPAMWLALLCLTFFAFLHGAPPPGQTVIANMTMLPSIFGQPWMSGAYWTLTIEIVFYVLSAGLFAFGILYRPVIIASFAVLLAAATAFPIYLRFAGISLPIQYISLHVSFLYLGLLLRMALVDRLAGATFGAIFVLLVQAVVLLSIGEFSLSRQDGFFLVGTTPILISYIAALCLFLFSVKTGKPQTPVLTWLGALSYSIYLFHGIAALIVFKMFPLTGNWTDGPIVLVCLLLTLAISLFVYECLEKPMINLGYKFIKQNNKTESKATI